MVQRFITSQAANLRSNPTTINNEVKEMEKGDLALECVCFEPEGEVTRKVHYLPHTQENLLIFWEKAKQFPTLFNQDINQDFNKFCNLFLGVTVDGKIKANGLMFVIDDFIGVFYLTDINSIYDAQVHYTFFDKRHRGRIDLVKKMIHYIFEEYGFRRISAALPFYIHEPNFTAVRQFVEHCGFKKEGRKRKSVLHGDILYDENLYSVIREDVIK